MKILMVSDGYFPERISGSYRYLTALSMELTKRGHEVHVIIPKSAEGLKENEIINGVVMHRFNYNRRLPVISFLSQIIGSRRKFKEILREIKPSLINFHHALPSIGIISIKQIKRIPMVYTFYGPWGEEYSIRNKPSLLSYLYAKIMLFFENYVLKRCKRFLVLSEFSRKQLNEIHGIPLERISIILAGLDIDFFSPGSKMDARRRLNIPEKCKVLLTVRRLDPRMGLDILLKAFKIVKEQIGEIRLIIVGSGPSLVALKKLRDDLGISDSVDFAGFATEEELVFFYRAADMTVIPSKGLEGFGLMTIESLSCGIPVMGTPIGSTIEILGTFNKNLLFTGIHPDSMAEKIIQVFSSDADSILPTGEECRSYIKKNYRMDEMVKNVEDFYFETLKKKILIIDSASEIGGAEIFLLRFIERLNMKKYQPLFFLLQKEGRLSEELLKRRYSVTSIAVELSTWRKPVPECFPAYCPCSLPQGQALQGHAYQGGGASNRILLVPEIFNWGKVFSMGVKTIPQLFKIFFQIKKMDVDIIQTSCNKSHIFGTIFAVFSGIPVLWTLHDYISKEHFSFPLRKLLVIFSLFSDRIVAFSYAVRNQFISEGAQAKKIVTVHYGIDAANFRGEAKEGIRREFKISEKTKVITVIGRISYWKGQEYLIRSIPKIIRSFPDSKFLIVGDAIFGEMTVKRDMEKLIRDTGLTDYCIMSGWRNDIPGILMGTDILVHTSSRPEPFGLVLLEGMAMGKPIVATNMGGVTEIIFHGITGLLVRPADSDAIAEAVINLLLNPAEADRMGRAGQERVERFFDIGVMSKKIEMVYDEIIEEGTRKKSKQN